MKKCPGCGSIASDSDASCGVCGISLLETPPMEESLEQSELAATAENQADLTRFTRKEEKSEAAKTLVGLLVGVSLAAGGLFSFLQDFFLIGSLVLVIGLFTIGVSALGGLGEGGLRLLIGWGLPTVDELETDAEKWRKEEMSDYAFVCGMILSGKRSELSWESGQQLVRFGLCPIRGQTDAV